MSQNVQAVYHYWKSFDLPEFQKLLDHTATELASRQDECDASRKRLIELSRQFKRNTAEDVMKMVAPLLKSFQTEIDTLTKRSKSAEASFLSIYKKLIDVPDPIGALEHANTVQKKAFRVQDLEVENKKLRETIADYNSEFAEVKNQDVTIKQLKDKLKEYEDQMEVSILQRINEKEKELNKKFVEKENQLQESHLSLAKKLGEAEQKAVVLQNALDSIQSELFEMKVKYDEATTAKSDEIELIMADLERANEKAASAERTVDHLKEQLYKLQQACQSQAVSQSAPDMEHAIDILKQTSLEVELAAKEKEVSQLVEDIQHLQSSLNKFKDMSTMQIARLEEEVASKSRMLQTLEDKLKSQQDYDELKRELCVLKSVEFSNERDSSQGAEVNVKTLETLLLEKNRSLLTENTQLKAANRELTDQCNKLKEQNTGALNTIQEQKSLISQLEEDLRNVNALSVMFRGDAEGEAGTPKESTEFVASIVKNVSSTDTDAPRTMETSVKAAADSLLPIVQSQRERFRARAQELEMQIVIQQQQVQLLQNEMDKLRSDNIKLYEKIKFLQSYSSKNVSADETECKYAAQYDEKLDPFTSFNKKERLRKYMDLKPYDRVTLGMSRLILGNKVARTFLFFYTLFLHVLVFLVLYKLAYTSSCKRDLAEECHSRFAEHMAKVHGSSM